MCGVSFCADRSKKEKRKEIHQLCVFYCVIINYDQISHIVSYFCVCSNTCMRKTVVVIFLNILMRLNTFNMEYLRSYYNPYIQNGTILKTWTWVQ